MSILNDERFKRVDELSLKELKQLQAEAIEEETQRLDPLHRLYDEYMDKLVGVNNDIEDSRALVHGALDQIDKWLEGVEQRKPQDIEALPSVDLKMIEIKSLLSGIDKKSVSEKELHKVLMQMHEKITEIMEVYHGIDQGLTNIIELKELILEKEAMEGKDEPNPPPFDGGMKMR